MIVNCNTDTLLVDTGALRVEVLILKSSNLSPPGLHPIPELWPFLARANIRMLIYIESKHSKVFLCLSVSLIFCQFCTSTKLSQNQASLLFWLLCHATQIYIYSQVPNSCPSRSQLSLSLTVYFDCLFLISYQSILGFYQNFAKLYILSN